MKLDTREVGNLPIVDFQGNLDTNTSFEAEEYLKELIDQGNTKIVANFDKLGFISSSGLRILLVTAKRLRVSNGDLHICNLNETVQEIFDISGLGTILSVFTSEENALDGFSD